MKCFHHDDADGWCSAAIIKREYPDCEMIECTHGNAIDLSGVQSNERVFMVDYTFKPYLFDELMNKTKNIVWIDHHKHVFADEYKKFSHLEGIRCSIDAACELTWQYLHPDTMMPDAVKYIGDYDAWKHVYGKKTACFYSYVSVSLDKEFNDLNSPLWDSLLDVDKQADTVEWMMKEGRIYLDYRTKFCEQYIKRHGFEVEFEGHKCLAVGIHFYGSATFGDKIDEYPLCIAFTANGENWSVGLYSKKVDVSEISAKYGGGGHSGAAGFVTKQLPFEVVKVD